MSVEPPAASPAPPVAPAPAAPAKSDNGSQIAPSQAVTPTVAAPAPAVAPSSDVESAQGDGRRLVYLPLDAIAPSPFQPRSAVREDALRELAASIRASGVMQPIVVRRASSDRYELIAGERRWRASKLAGLATIPAVLAEVDDRTAAEWALVENIQREDLNPVDRARAFRTLADTFGLSHAQVAERVGLDRATVTNLVRLTELEPEVLDLLAEGRISAGHGKALLSAPAGPSRVALARRVADEQWSVRALEDHARAASTAPTAPGMGAGAPGASNEKRPAPTATRERSAQVVALEKQLSEHLSSKVRIKARPGATKGRIEIEFYDLDHFDSLMDRLGFAAQ